MIIKRIHSQDAHYKTTPKNSGETSLNLSNEILQFIAPNLSKGNETSISFTIYREDYLKALGVLFNSSPLYITTSNSSKEVKSDPNIFINDFKSICSFFGSNITSVYTVNLIYRPDGRIYLNSLEDKTSKFNIRHFLLEESSFLAFDQDKNGIYIRLRMDSEIDTLDNLENNPLQKIFYGTPGSGKSHKVNDEILKGVDDEYVFRTTFHPDSDYASFVGCYKPQMDGKDIEYKFTPQSFTLAYQKAWKEPEKQVYLVIEEINRGNCAQIFGDLFQLLDRKGGVSEYPINADADLRQHLENELGKGNEGIENGKLKLPANLNILATMNTSDQSLFPMDSAFKRRWSWECVPIDYEHEESSKFEITIGGKPYKWNNFLKEVNERIVKATDSEDKQMGNFFINGNIEERQFIDKVMFYLWNDICKEEYHTDNNFFRNFTDDKHTDSKEFSFNQLFGAESTTLLEGFMEYLGVKAES